MLYPEQPLQSSSSDAVVPPPPQPHSEERPHKRLRCKQRVDERAVEVETGQHSTTDSNQEVSLSVPSEDFYRMVMRALMEAFVWKLQTVELQLCMHMCIEI